MDYSKLFEKHSLIPVVVKDYQTGSVLNVAFMNEEALRRTLKTLEVWYCSRTSRRLWTKESSSAQRLVSMYVDCKNEALLIKVKQTGKCCHTGHSSCFYKRVWPEEH